MINIETDSHGRTYQLWRQQQANSCGVAATWMARGIVRQMSINEDEWSLAQRVYRNAVENALAPLGAAADGGMSLDPAAHPNDRSTMASALANAGFFARQLALALRGEGMRVHHAGFTGYRRVVVPNRISITQPAIALIYWDNGGGHFVVVGRCTRSAITYLDPWDGHIIEQSNNGVYNARYNRRGQIGEILYLTA
jgi:hypothetical protein